MRALARKRPVVLAGAIVAVALVAWIVTVQRMRGMDGGPGTALGTLGWYVGIWVTMMAAMMLPSIVPMAVVFHRVTGERRRNGHGGVPVWIFLAGYLAAWTVYGIAAYGLWRLVVSQHWGFLSWGRAGPVAAGVVVALAGVYELTPLKRVCLRHCRSPLHFVLHSWRDGWTGALRMGVVHGGWCVGCCWGLMVVLFAVGVMSLFWMAVVTAAIFAEKMLPWRAVTPVVAVCLVALGIWIAVDPGSVPLLHEPGTGSMPGMNM